jgi:hypothetical protein
LSDGSRLKLMKWKALFALIAWRIQASLMNGSERATSAAAIVEVLKTAAWV